MYETGKRLLALGLGVLGMIAASGCGAEGHVVVKSVITDPSETSTSLVVSGTIGEPSTTGDSTVAGATTSSMSAASTEGTLTPTTTKQASHGPAPTSANGSTPTILDPPPSSPPTTGASITTPPTTGPPTTPPPTAAVPTTLPQDVITLQGEDPPAGTIDGVTLTVNTLSGQIPQVTLISGECTVTGSGTPNPVLVLDNRNLTPTGSSCVARATGNASAGFNKPSDKDLSITWTARIIRASWTNVNRIDPYTFSATSTLPDEGDFIYLSYSGDCSGPDRILSDSTTIQITVSPPSPCTVSGESHGLNQTSWVVVDPLVLSV
jgi:hypothetical protein